MCQFQQLYNDETGYVVRCNRCNYYQVLFAGTMMSITADEFDKFVVQVAIQKRCNDNADPQVKSIVLATPRLGVHLFLSKQELYGLGAMIECADAEIKALALLELFNG